MPHTILALTSLYAAEIRKLMTEQLEGKFTILWLQQEADPEAAIRAYLNDIVAVISSPSNHVRRALIEALPNLELIANFGVGVDNIDLQAAKERHVAVTNTPDLVTEDTADIALALMLATARRVVEGDVFIRVGKWYNGSLPLGTRLRGKKAGILGLGRIGKAVAHRAQAFGMEIGYSARAPKDDASYPFFATTRDLAAWSDFLVVTCNGGEETRGIVNAETLNALGPKGFLINVARGSVVDEEALLVALNNRDIAGAGLDVFPDEPHVHEGLLSRDNVVLLPHIGTATLETRLEMGQLVADNIKAYFNGEPLKTPVAA